MTDMAPPNRPQSHDAAYASWSRRKRAWWWLRMFGHALLLREFEDAPTQRTLKERFPSV